MKQFKEISRHVSCALRHTPEAYGLVLDETGAVEIRKLLESLRKIKPAWTNLDEQVLQEITQAFEKKRFQITGDKIRAYYGHSVDVELESKQANPPAILYHGTSDLTLPAIRQTGLKSMNRQYVHLSSDVETALQVAHRKKGKPVLLAVDTRRANEAGVKFYLGNQTTWLADEIAWELISVQ